MCRKNQRGSMTVEASLVLPVFLFAALSVIYINKFILYEEQVQWALARVAREASVEYAVSGKEAVVNPVYLTGKMNQYLKEDGLTVSMMRSRFDPENDELDLIADYQAEIPFPLVSRKRFVFTEQVHTRAFTGVKTRVTGGDEEDVIVYITKTGKVYHRKLSCTYLTLSISQVKYKDLEYLRSEGGGKYYACENCCGGRKFGAEDDVLVCNYGNRFHCLRTCKNMKRSIQEIPLSEAGSRIPCSKCGKE